MNKNPEKFSSLNRLVVVLLISSPIFLLSNSFQQEAKVDFGTISVPTTEGGTVNNNSSTVQGLVTKWNELVKNIKYQEAIAYYDMALAIDPNNTNALIDKAETFSKLNRYDEAIKSYDKVLAIQPTNISILYSKADILPYLGRYNEAIAIYDKIFSLNPHSSNSLGRKGLALYDTGRLEEAVTYFNKVFKTIMKKTPSEYKKASKLTW